MAAEDYRRLARLALTDAPPTLELISDVRFHDEDVNAYNILSEIPGTDPRAGYVMAGAHFDSWVAPTARRTMRQERPSSWKRRASSRLSR
jgi:hypothetical protein